MVSEFHPIRRAGRVAPSGGEVVTPPSSPHQTPAPRLQTPDNASGEGHAAEVTSDGGPAGSLPRRECMAMAVGVWPFETWPDPRIFPNTGAMIDDRSDPDSWAKAIPYLKGNQ